MESRVFGRFFQLLHSHFSRGHLKTRISLPKEYTKSAYSVSRRNTSTISMVEETLNEQRSEGPAERFAVVTKMFFEDEVKRNSVPMEMVYEQHCKLLGSVIGSEKEARKVIIKSSCGAVHAFLTMEQVTALRRCADANGPKNPEVAHVFRDSKIIPF